MASTSSSSAPPPTQLPLWSMENLEQRDIVMDCSYYSRKLVGNLGAMATIIDLDIMWPTLRELEVVDSRKQSTIEVSVHLQELGPVEF